MTILVHHNRRTRQTLSRRLAPLPARIVADYLAGASCRELAEQHGLELRIAEETIRHNTTREQRHAKVQRNHAHRRRGTAFPLPELSPDPVRPLVWQRIVTLSRHFLRAGFPIDEARGMAVGVTEKERDLSRSETGITRSFGDRIPGSNPGGTV